MTYQFKAEDFMGEFWISTECALGLLNAREQFIPGPIIIGGSGKMQQIDDEEVVFEGAVRLVTANIRLNGEYLGEHMNEDMYDTIKYTVRKGTFVSASVDMIPYNPKIHG